MTAKIISVGNQKGGAGKSTVSMQLAGYLSARFSVLVVDADGQATSMKWAAQADDPPFPATVVNLADSGAKIHRELQRHAENYDFVIVDCPPSVTSPVPQSAFLVSDLVIVPTRPSLPDIWAVKDTLALIEKAKIVNEGLLVALLVNSLQPNTQLGRDAVELLEGLDAHVFKVKLHQRQAYPQSVVFGGTVKNISGAKPAQKEMDDLVKEVLALVGVK